MSTRSMLLALTAILLLLAGCSNGSKIEWRTKDFGPLTFEYPKNWVMRDLSDQGLAYISRESYKPAIGVKDSVIILLGYGSDRQSSVRDDFIGRFLVGEDGTILSESEEQVGGYPATKIVTEQPEESEEADGEIQTIHTIAYEVDTQSNLMVLFYVQYKDGYENDVDIFEHLLESVTFDPTKRQAL